MVANGENNSPLYFDHLYDFQIVGDPDSIVGLPYRTIVIWSHRKWVQVYYIYNLSLIL